MCEGVWLLRPQKTMSVQPPAVWFASGRWRQVWRRLGGVLKAGEGRGDVWLTALSAGGGQDSVGV